MSLSSDLFRLQKIDTRLDQCTNRIREIEQILASDQAVRQAQIHLDTVDKELLAAHKQLKIAEGAVQSQNNKLELNQKSLYGGKVRNPKELQDLQNEAAALKRQIAMLEDQQLEAMMQVEQVEATRNLAAEQLTETQQQAASRQALLIGERNRLLKDIERLESERLATTHSLPENSLFVYNNLRNQKRGLAVVEVMERTCSACGQTLTPAEWQVARSPHQLAFCPNCARILYAG